MKFFLCFLKICFLSFPLFVYSQKIEIIKDTVCLSGQCFEFQELKINKPLIYKEIQSAYHLFDNKTFTKYEDRLSYKKRLFKEYKSEKTLQESQYGFENYEIYFNKNNLLNMSISLQVYGSPYEDTKYFTFDLKEDKNISNLLFKNKKNLIKACLKKLEKIYQIKISLNFDNLSNYKINENESGDIYNLIFVFTNPKNRGESYEVNFSYDEIKPYIKQKYLTLL
ncbi:hypothetical protein [Kaistella yonginensis]|uniref:hypothetical protein n=1 Tax=Kaistella yonginensis TaxID=658267 RepID=UPI0025B2C29C|nr:hypothetical protein [Kaistella yonginensis]MDN3606398.1 hypothetical protein [Kaistella yonginensis]